MLVFDTGHALINNPSSSAQHGDIETPSSQQHGDNSVYSLRLKTAYARGAALSDPLSAVNLLLLGRDGRAVLQRLPPFNDTQVGGRAEPERHMRGKGLEGVQSQQPYMRFALGCSLTCEARGDEGVHPGCSLLSDIFNARADGLQPSHPSGRDPQACEDSDGVPCTASVLPPSTSTTPAAGRNSSSSASSSFTGPTPQQQQQQQQSVAKARFQQGAVDEVSFLAPELGPLAGVLIGVESGSWGLEEVTVSSSQTGYVDR